jgi:hypothetical protein
LNQTRRTFQQLLGVFAGGLNPARTENTRDNPGTCRHMRVFINRIVAYPSPHFLRPQRSSLCLPDDTSLNIGIGHRKQPEYRFPEDTPMWDIGLLLITALFFAVAVVYTYGCDKLRRKEDVR